MQTHSSHTHMKKVILLLTFTFTCFLSQSQIIINELEADAGNNDGNGGDWIEFKNIGTSSEDMSCWRLTNGGSVIISFPNGLIVPAGAYVLVGNASKMMCATCDYKSMSSLFTLNANGFGTGTGLYANTIFLNTDLALNGGCGCLTGSGNYNNGSGTGDRVMLMTDAGAIIDAMLYAGGNNYGSGPINVNFAGTSSCGLNPTTLPDVTSSIYDGRTICNDLTGCNSSYARLPDGNNGAIVTYDQSGNLGCTNCILPCTSGSTNTAGTDFPTPGLSNGNSSSTWTATLNGAPMLASTTTLSVCGATPLTFTYQIKNFTNTSLVAIQPSGNLGSYISTNGGTPTTFTGTNFNATTGVTTLTTTITPPNGITTYEFVWGDGNVNCTTCPGSSSTSIPTNLSSNQQECYVSRTLIVSRENPLAGLATASCSLPGTITVNGATGTNLQYTLQKQSVASGPFITIGSAQSSNIIGGIFDDDADPALPNYQVLVSTVNTSCPNPTPLVVAVPNSCLGNPACPQYFTTGSGVPTFTPNTGSIVCAGSTVQFNVTIKGVCTTGQVEVKYDFNPAFDPYASGISLGTAGTAVGTTPPTTTASGRVFINEFVPRPGAGTCGTLGITPNGASPNSGEWIELYNAGPSFVDISGWIVSDGDWTATIPAGVLLNTGTYYLIGGGGTFCSSGVLPDLNIETCNCTTVSPTTQDIMNLTDGGEQLALYDCSGNYIDGVLWNVGQGLPDVTANIAPATGCGNYILSKSVNLPAAASFAATGTNFSGTTQGRYRTNTNSWITTSTTGVVPTPKAANPGGNWDGITGATIPFGTQCPPPPVTSVITVTIPDTCSLTAYTNLTLKAIYKPDPIAPCTKSDVTATADFAIPPCDELTLSGNGDYCAPSTAPVSITTSSPLIGNYTINLSNGTNTVSINPVSGAGPFTTTVANSGVWTIANTLAPFGICPPKRTGSAIITINPIPQITSAPTNAAYCYSYPFDLASLEPSIVTSPSTTHFVWYDSAVGGVEINPYVFPLGTTTYYVAATTGLPANCEEVTRTPITLNTLALPEVPNLSSNGVVATFTPQSPNCTPFPCPSGLQYSADGINWGAGPSFTFTDPGWAGFGSPANSLVYIRNAASPSCFNYVTYLGSYIPLPTELFHFMGHMNDEGTVDLFWKTAQEKNVSHFEIEKSTDKTSFTKIGDVNAVGNTAIITDYAFNDPAPYNGANYYRLKITDIDEQYAYSNVILMQSNSNTASLAAIYPNPANESVTLELNAPLQENSLIEIFDALGRRVISTSVLLQKGYNKSVLAIEQLTKGHYTIRLQLNSTSVTRNFIKE